MKKHILAAVLATLAMSAAYANDAAIRKALKASYPEMPEVSSIQQAPVKGLFEIVVGSEILYTDAQGRFLFQGNLIDVATKKSITEERLQVVNRIDFKELPLADAIVSKSGTGARKLAVFADPNCGFCKKLERETVPLLKDVTIYTFLMPILSADSTTKSRNIWCAKDKAKAWEDWIQREIPPPVAADGCNSKAIDANLELARKYRITGTPTMIFESGIRLPGALPLEEVSKQLAAAASR